MDSNVKYLEGQPHTHILRASTFCLFKKPAAKGPFAMLALPLAFAETAPQPLAFSLVQENS